MMASRSGNKDARSSDQGIPSDLRARDLPSKRLLGKGLASIVYETEWNGERFARKDFIGVPSGAFQKEAAILVDLKDHENVVKTHGRTVDRMSCSLVLEYMEEDLLDLLQKRKESQGGASGTASGSRCEGNPSYPFDLSEALAILSQIARGMEFLHEQNIPHGDLKTKNILVSHINDGDKNVLSVKLADFGLVRTKSKSMSFVSRQARKLDVVQWKAPEVLERLLSEDNDVTTSESDSNSDTERTGSPGVSDRLGADVYSFAVTCSQILTGEFPYPNGNWKELGSKIVSGELRPNLPAACPGLLKSVLDLCWAKSIARRPTFSYIRQLLDFWLVDPEVRGHLSLKEVQANIKFLDNPPPFKTVSLKGKHPLDPQRETSPSPAQWSISSTPKGQDSMTSLASSKSSPVFRDWLGLKDSNRFADPSGLAAERTVKLRAQLYEALKRPAEPLQVEPLTTPVEWPEGPFQYRHIEWPEEPFQYRHIEWPEGFQYRPEGPYVPAYSLNPDADDVYYPGLNMPVHSIPRVTKPRPVGEERLVQESVEEIVEPSEQEPKK